MSTKPKLTPPEHRAPQAPNPFSPDQRAGRLKLIVSLIFVLLLATAFAVVIVLPERLANEQGPAGESIRPQEPQADQRHSPLNDAAQEQDSSEKLRAERLLKTVLKQQAALEAEGVKIWGLRIHVTSYPDVLAKLGEADAHFAAQRYGQSAGAYQETIGLMEQLESSRPERARRGLQAGMEALDRFDVAAATEEFEMVLALDPANAEARHGLKRVPLLPRVKELVAAGQVAEERNDLEQARKAYGEAVKVDSESDVARSHLERVDNLIRQRQFELAVSQASSALARADFAGTREALQRARQLQPDAVEVREIGLRLQARERQAELARLRKLAQAHERKENWSGARKAYRRALAIDPTAAFALEGRKRAERYALLIGIVDGYLAEPHTLQSAQTRNSARETWQQVGRLDAGRRLREKNDRLGKLISAYERPVPVVLRSDGMTDVVLYRVGKLGKFQEHRRELLPGLYTVLGTRSGYRDVKIKFEVPVSGVVSEVSVICRETI